MTDHDRANDSGDIVVECTLDAPPEKVWRALTEPELLAAWLLPGDIRPEPGHRFSLAGNGADLERAIDCTVLDADPHRRLRYTWRVDGADTVVSFELERLPADRTHLRLVHGGFRTATTMAAANDNAVRSLCLAA